MLGRIKEKLSAIGRRSAEKKREGDEFLLSAKRRRSAAVFAVTIFSISVFSSAFFFGSAEANVDTTPPLTTPSHWTGSYPSSISVTLTPNETATTYYSTDGSNPSIVYSAPISISTTTTLRYYSVDASNNTEVIRGQIYTIDPGPYSIGGAVSGLSGTIVLQNNGGNDLSISANGAFSFSTEIAYGVAYNATILTQPSGYTCSVSSGSGTATGDVTNITVSCAEGDVNDCLNPRSGVACQYAGNYSWTVPAGISYISLEVRGAGGSGGSEDDEEESCFSASGGSSGGNSTVSYGGTTKATANGGAGGGYGCAGTDGFGGAGGTGSGSLLSQSVTNGSNGVGMTGGSPNGGAGGNGGIYGNGGGGGGGAKVTGLLAVVPGQTLSFTVGAHGSTGQNNGGNGSVILSWENSYTSTIKEFSGVTEPVYGEMDWVSNVPTGTTLTMRARTSNDSGMGGAHVWGDACNVPSSGTDISTVSECVIDGHRYVQYQAVFSSTNTEVPTLSSVTISTQATHPTFWQKIISSVFNTTDPNNAVSDITWNETGTGTGANEGVVGFQIRTAPDNGSGEADWASPSASGWCGPLSCSANPGEGGDGNFYTTKEGNSINGAQTDNAGNQWLQYAAFIKSNEGNEGTTAPVLQDVSIAYSYNVPPAISVSGYTQNSDGSVSVPYTLSQTYDDDGAITSGTTSNAIRTRLFYQPHAGIKLQASGSTLASDYTGPVTLDNPDPDNIPVPSQGYALIENELVSFDSGTATSMNITGRGLSFDDPSNGTDFYTTPAIHIAGKEVFFMATLSTIGSDLYQTIGGCSDGGCNALAENGTEGATASTGEMTFSWNPRGEQYLGLNSKKLDASMIFKVVANDANTTNVNNISLETGAKVEGQTLDLQKPTITSVTTTQEPDEYRTGSGLTIPVTINFSESVTSTGDIEFTLNTGYPCTATVTNGTSATCQYSVGSDENTPEGQFLEVTGVSGIIKDGKSNQMDNFSIPVEGELSDSSQITIDNEAPTADDMSDLIKKEEFTQSLSNAADSGSGIASYQWTKTSGTGNITFGTPTQSSTTISADADGTYVITATITDEAGNTTDKTLNLSWDTQAPNGSLTIGEGGEYSTTSSVTLSITADDGAGSGVSDMRFSNDNSIWSDWEGYAATKESWTLSSGDGSKTVYVELRDGAQNVSQAYQAAVTLDTTAPTIDGVSADKGTGKYKAGTEIIITVNFSENVNSQDGVIVALNSGGSCQTEAVSNLLSADCTYTVQGSDTNLDNLSVSNVSGTVADRAGNALSDFTIGTNLPSGIAIDTVSPSFSTFTTSSLESVSPTTNIYSLTNNQINIQMVYDEDLRGDSAVDVVLRNTAVEDTVVELRSVSGNIIEGTYTVQGPYLGHDVNPLNIERIGNENVYDIAGNPQQSSSVALDNNILGGYKRLIVDTGPPSLESLSAPAGAYKEGETVTITADYSEDLGVGSVLDVKLNTNDGAERDQKVELRSISGDKLTGTYTVELGHKAQNLQVTSLHDQYALDLIGNYLDTENLPADNIDNVQVDTDAPQLGASPVAINIAGGRTSDNVIPIDLDATDNFNLTSVQFSLDYSDDGNENNDSWCDPVTYEDPKSFDITAACGGGTDSIGDKTVTARFLDAAGNVSATGSATVFFDKEQPFLESVTANPETANASGIYGPQSVFTIEAKYHETLSSGSLKVNLNNGVTVLLDNVSGDRITGTYEVGATGSGQDTTSSDGLKVTGITEESVFDTSSPANGRNNSDVPSINISAIEIDTTGPEGSIVFDRSKNSGQVHVEADDENADGMKYEMAAVDDLGTSCGLPGAYADSYTGGESGQDIDLADNDSASKKVCIRFRDAVGNESANTYIAVAPETPENISYSDITNLDITPPFKGVFILWPKPTIMQDNDLANFEAYDLKSCETDTGSVCDPSATLKRIDKDDFDSGVAIETNYFLHQELSEDSKYCYKLRVQDVFGNYSAFSETTCVRPSEGTVLSGTAVEIQDISIGAETNSSATVSFRTVDANHSDNPLPTSATVEVYDNDQLTGTPVGTFTETFGVSH
ncbi:MAG: S-layer domain protein, partial [Parcubacteria group bacterium GW2011_GWC1_45_14]